MFSVIIPLYNKESSVKDTLLSVLGQTFTDFEIIVVNDGSCDNSVEIVEKIKDSRIRLIHQANQGVSVARNRGIKESKFDWITFLDADDLWLENHLYEYFKSISNHRGLKWLISGYTSKRRGKLVDHIYCKGGVLNNIFDDLNIGVKIHTSSVCINKDLFSQYPELFFKKGINNSEDREVWYKLCCIDKNPFYIRLALSIYKTDVDNSLTNNTFFTDSEQFLTMKDRLKDFDPYNDLSEEDRDKLDRFIYNYNRKAVRIRYVNGKLNIIHADHLPKWEYKLLYYTSGFSFLFKRLINKLLS